MITRLTPDGYGGRRNGSFAGKSASGGTHPVLRITRLGYEGYGVRRNTTFADKGSWVGSGTHDVGIITRLGPDGYGVRRAGDFSGKSADTGASATVIDAGFRKFGASRPPQRTYAPPHKKPPKDIEDLKATYKQARRTLPADIQVGLIPLAVQTKSKLVTAMPDAKNVDFEKLIEDDATVKSMKAALQKAEAAKAEKLRTKRRREEEALLSFILKLD